MRTSAKTPRCLLAVSIVFWIWSSLSLHPVVHGLSIGSVRDNRLVGENRRLKTGNDGDDDDDSSKDTSKKSEKSGKGKGKGKMSGPTPSSQPSTEPLDLPEKKSKKGGKKSKEKLQKDDSAPTSMPSIAGGSSKDKVKKSKSSGKGKEKVTSGKGGMTTPTVTPAVVTSPTAYPSAASADKKSSSKGSREKLQKGKGKGKGASVATTTPTAFPSFSPTKGTVTTSTPTDTPTVVLVAAPTSVPTEAGTMAPTMIPTIVPTDMVMPAPTDEPTATTSMDPTMEPTEMPTVEDVTDAPTLAPSALIVEETSVPSPVSLSVELFEFLIEYDLGEGNAITEPSDDEYEMLRLRTADFYLEVLNRAYAENENVTVNSMEIEFRPDRTPQFGPFQPSDQTFLDFGLVMELYIEYTANVDFAEGSIVPPVEEIQFIFDQAQFDVAFNLETYILAFVRPIAPVFASTQAVYQAPLIAEVA